MQHSPPTRPQDRRLPGAAVRLALLAVLCGALAGCKTGGEQDVDLPGLIGQSAAGPGGVFALIRRADVPLDEPTDDAWSIINEQVVPPLTRGAWRANGLRLGLLRRDQLDAYAEAMPQPVAFGESMINQSRYPVPILETARLRGDLRFEIDLTRPPKPRHIEDIKGGDNSRLRILARIETDEQGRHAIVLTPQHYVPSRFDLVPRDPLDKELDGRVYDELTVRLVPGKDQIAVVGLYWPWPVQEVLPDEPDNASPASPSHPLVPTGAGDPASADDPAAPPPHIPRPELPGDEPRDRAGDEGADGEADEAGAGEPELARVAPPLPTNFGSTLLTSNRIRRPVRTVLLISVVAPGPETATE